MTDPKQSYKERVIEEFDQKFFIAGKNCYGEEKGLLFPAKCEVRDFISQALDNQMKEVMDYTREQLDYAISRAAGNYDGEAGGAVDAYQDIINFLNKLG